MVQRTLPAHIIRRVSVNSGTDPRTVARVLRDQRTLPMTRERIVAAIKAEGFGHVLEKKDDGPRAA